MTTLYTLLMQAFGIFAVAIAMAVVNLHGLSRDEFVLALLGMIGGWLRFRLAPSGFLTLTPIAFFASLLLVKPWEAFVVAVASVVAGAVLFGKSRLQVMLEESGEECVPPLVAAIVYWLASSPSDSADLVASLPAYLAAVGAYVAIRLVVGFTSGFLREGVGSRAFLLDAGRVTAANVMLHAIIALVLQVFLYNRFGYFALLLATVALAEFYHPWKLLSEQEGVLFMNLAMVAQAIDMKDPYTARHSRNVARIATRLARALGLPEGEVRKIRIGALMHDIGKIGVSTAIIRKPSKLDPDEQHSMRAHPVISANIMQPIELLAEASEIVRHHHEHYDGTGYPSGLKGEEIPIGSRVILVADAFDAMTTDRPYRLGRSKEEAVQVLKDRAGTQFDATVVHALESILELL